MNVTISFWSNVWIQEVLVFINTGTFSLLGETWMSIFLLYWIQRKQVPFHKALSINFCQKYHVDTFKLFRNMFLFHPNQKIQRRKAMCRNGKQTDKCNLEGMEWRGFTNAEYQKDKTDCSRIRNILLFYLCFIDIGNSIWRKVV